MTRCRRGVDAQAADRCGLADGLVEVEHVDELELGGCGAPGASDTCGRACQMVGSGSDEVVIS